MFLEVSCNFIMFVCTWTTILPNCRSILQSRFCRGSSHMDDHTVLYIGVGLAQAHPNYVINNYCQLCIYHYVAWVSTMPWIVKLQRLQSSILGWHGRPYHENEWHRLWSVHIRLVRWTMPQWIKLWRSLTLCLFGMCSEHHQQYRLQTKTA